MAGIPGRRTLASVSDRRIDYDRGLHEGYADARRLLGETAELWMGVAKRFIPAAPGLRILDVGSGTGRFSPLLAEALNADVVGVEPSDGMRSKAEAGATHPSVRYLKGSADSLPVEDAGFHAGWMSMVIHHVPDLDACARELFRVLTPGGRLLIRNPFSGRLAGIPMFEFFPSALAIDTARVPTAERLREVFGRAGFSVVADEDIEQTLALSFDEFVERTKKRNASTFELISDAEFAEGIRRMEVVALSGSRPGPVREKIGLLVFRR